MNPIGSRYRALTAHTAGAMIKYGSDLTACASAPPKRRWIRTESTGDPPPLGKALAKAFF